MIEKGVKMKKILLSSIVLFMIFMTTGCFSDNNEKFANANFYPNTKWKNTDGYVLEIYDESCKITKDGKVMSNVCHFTADANETGIGKLEICNEYGTNCSSKDIDPQYNKYTDYITIKGYQWYKQDK